MTARRIAGIAALSALALVSFLIESLFPPLLLPGAKLGLGNIFVLAALFFYGGTGGMIALAVKLLLGNLITGNLSALMYGCPQAPSRIWRNICSSALSIRAFR